MDLIGITLFFMILIAGGMLFSVPAYIPTIRRSARRNPKVRVGVVFGLSGFAWVIIYVGFAYLGAMTTKIFQSITSGGSSLTGHPFEAEITIELWLRNLLPVEYFAGADRCYSETLAVCEAIQSQLLYYNNPPLSDHVFMMIIAGASMLACAFAALHITKAPPDLRKKKKDYH